MEQKNNMLKKKPESGKKCPKISNDLCEKKRQWKILFFGVVPWAATCMR